LPASAPEPLNFTELALMVHSDIRLLFWLDAHVRSPRNRRTKEEWANDLVDHLGTIIALPEFEMMAEESIYGPYTLSSCTLKAWERTVYHDVEASHPKQAVKTGYVADGLWLTFTRPSLSNLDPDELRMVQTRLPEYDYLATSYDYVVLQRGAEDPGGWPTPVFQLEEEPPGFSRRDYSPKLVNIKKMTPEQWGKAEES
jgi:hypothetical protein